MTPAPTPSARQRLLLGDWGPVVRDPLDLMRLALVVAAVVTLGVRGLDGGSAALAFTAAVAVAARPLLLLRLYDLLLLVVPLLGSGVLYVALARLDVLPDPRDDTGWRHHLGIAIVTFSLGAALGAVWELVEWFSDGVLGSALQEGNTDTVGDLAMDCLGALCGAALLVLWTVRGWGSVRRVPGTIREAHD